MKAALLFLLLAGCTRPQARAPEPDAPTDLKGLRGAEIMPPAGPIFTIRTNTWITIGPGIERLTNGNVVLSVHIDRITRIQRVPVLYSNGARIGPVKGKL